MSGPDYIAIQIVIYCTLGFVIGYGCRSLVCSDNAESQIKALEEEIDDIEQQTNDELDRRSNDILERIGSFNSIQAFPVVESESEHITPSAPMYDSNDDTDNSV
jgi:hypothetical protein